MVLFCPVFVLLCCCVCFLCYVVFGCVYGFCFCVVVVVFGLGLVFVCFLGWFWVFGCVFWVFGCGLLWLVGLCLVWFTDLVDMFSEFLVNRKLFYVRFWILNFSWVCRRLGV